MKRIKVAGMNRTTATRIVAGLVVLLLIGLVVWRFGTGFGGYETRTTTIEGGTVTDTYETHRGKTLWDWMELLIVPVLLAGGAWWFSGQQRKAQREFEAGIREAQREFEDDRVRESALQTYLDRMTDLLLKEDLRNSEEDSDVRKLARARTLSTLSRLDPTRKRTVLEFLFEARLVGYCDIDYNRYKSIVSLANADLSGVDLGGSFLAGIDLTDVNLSKTNLSFTYLQGANLYGADLQGANLHLADLEVANLRDADLHGANLQGTNLHSVNLSCANLCEADLREANLGGALLSFANLSGANLSSAGLFRNLVGAGGAFLQGANLSGADVCDANFARADLRHADFTGYEWDEKTDFSGADCRGTKGLEDRHRIDCRFTESTKSER